MRQETLLCDQTLFIKIQDDFDVSSDMNATRPDRTISDLICLGKDPLRWASIANKAEAFMAIRVYVKLDFDSHGGSKQSIFVIHIIRRIKRYRKPNPLVDSTSASLIIYSRILSDERI